MLKSLKIWLKRYWQSKGFGIHSPFAYMFVTEIVHCPYSYYAYTDIANLSSKKFDKKTFHDAKLLHRVAARFSIHRSVVAEEENEMIKNALRLADGGMELSSSIKRHNGQIVYISKAEERLLEKLPMLIDLDMVFMFFRGLKKDESMKKWFDRIEAQLNHGVALRASDLGIIVVNKKMPAMSIDVRL